MSATGIRSLGPSNDRIPRAELRKAEESAALYDRNVRFQALPPERKRVAIARDVLKWLRMGKILATCGVYVERFEPGDNDFTLDGGSCNACALGSLFAGAAEYGCTTVGMRWADTSSHKDAIRAHLRGVFDEEQLGYIEAAFERRATHAVNTELGRQYNKQFPRAHEAEIWAYHIVDKDQRMAAIMLNIIRNGGTFNLDDPAPRR